MEEKIHYKRRVEEYKDDFISFLIENNANFDNVADNIKETIKKMPEDKLRLLSSHLESLLIATILEESKEEHVPLSLSHVRHVSDAMVNIFKVEKNSLKHEIVSLNLNNFQNVYSATAEEELSEEEVSEILSSLSSLSV